MDLDFYFIHIAQTAYKKTVALICFLKLVSLEVSLYLLKYTIQFCMEYFCFALIGSPTCYLELLDKLQKWSCRIAGPWFDTFAHTRNVTRLNSFLRYDFGRYLSNLAQMFLLLYSQEKSNHYSDVLSICFFCHHLKMLEGFPCQRFFFPRTGRLWDDRPIESFPLIYPPVVFNSRIRRHLLTQFRWVF